MPGSRAWRAQPENSMSETFDTKAFLAKVGEGKTITIYQKDQNVFEQGEAADTIFYLQKGKIKLTVQSERGKEAVVGIL
jgi:CRP/FNR family transcriptional regulator, cyclic AMP receptor protein